MMANTKPSLSIWHSLEVICSIPLLLMPTSVGAASGQPHSVGGWEGARVSKLWGRNVSDPLRPLSVDVVAELNVVAVGSRNCPTNSENQLQFRSAADGHLLGTRHGVSNVAVGHAEHAAATDTHVIAAGVGWKKGASTTALSLEVFPLLQNLTTGSALLHNGSYSREISGEPAMWLPSAISADARVAAFLVEKTPDEAHLNNRSGTLFVLNTPASGSGWINVFDHVEVDGLGASDPQSVSISSYANSEDVFLVGALIGFQTLVVEYYVETGRAIVVHHSMQDPNAGPEITIAMSPRGDFFATGNGSQVDLFHRDGTSTLSETHFKKTATLKPPEEGMTPLTMTVQQQPLATSLLSIAWGSPSGDALGISAHIIENSTTSVAWQFVYESACDFEDLSGRGLAVSPHGEIVAVGSFGCANPSLGQPNLHVFEGLGAATPGVPIFNETLNGEIWAVDVDIASTNTTAALAATTWGNSETGQSSRVTLYSIEKHV